MSNPSPKHESPNVLDVVLRHKKTIILCPLISLAFGALFFLFCPRTYRSESRLFLRIGRETVGIDATATTGQTVPLQMSQRSDEVKSAQEIFKSRRVAALVVDRLGADAVLGRGPGQGTSNWVANVAVKPIVFLVNLIKSVDPISDREDAIIEIERNLSVSDERQTTLVGVEYDAESPQLAQTICQAVVEVGQQEHIRVHRNEESSPFFVEQQQRLREQLDQALNALRNAKDEMGLASIEQRRTTLESQYNAIELDRLTSNQQLATGQARIEDLQRQLSELPERMIASKKSVPNLGADLLRERLYDLQVKSMDLEARYSDKHPLVRAVNAQLLEAKSEFGQQAEQRTETTDTINPIHRELTLAMKNERSVVAGLRSRVVELDKQKQALLADLRTVNQHDFTIDQLTRDAELARGKYMQYARTVEESRIDKELQNEGVSNISIVQAATMAEKPVSPRRGTTAAGTLLLAIGSTVALVFLGESRNANKSADSDPHDVMRRRPRQRLRRNRTSNANGLAQPDELGVATPK
jgi:uncharacterized protein involved in exopolysaccharide biosynthesis